MGHPRDLLAIVALLAVLIGCGPSSEEPTARPQFVILLLLDAARPDHFSIAGHEFETTPNMDRLAEQGLLFERHYAGDANTVRSLPVLLYGRYFAPALFGWSKQISTCRARDLFRAPDPSRTSIPAAFRAAGYATGAVSAHFWITEGSELARQFDDFILERREDADTLLTRALDWLDGQEGPAFLYVHLMDTHFPHHQNSFSRRFFDAPAPDTFDDEGRPPPEASEEERRYLRALYDGSLAFTDAAIGRFVDALDDRGWLDSSVIAITSDHGEHLLEVPGRLEHPAVWLEKVARAPLILFGPQWIPAGHYDGFTHAVDVAPSLLALVGGSIADAFDGHDLLEVVAGTVPRRDAVMMRRGIRTERYKAVFDQAPAIAEPGETARDVGGQLYDLNEDPLEVHDLFEERPEISQQLFEELQHRLGDKGRAFNRFVTDPPQPASAFAFLPKQLELPLEPGGEGWRLEGMLPATLVADSSDAALLEFDVPLPQGEYDWFLGFDGQLTLHLDGEEREIVGLGELEPLALGVCEPSQTNLLVGLEARGAVSVYYLSFRARGTAGNSDVNDQHLEALRELGYVSQPADQ